MINLPFRPHGQASFRRLTYETMLQFRSSSWESVASARWYVLGNRSYLWLFVLRAIPGLDVGVVLGRFLLGVK